jgi:K+-transporting ATPase KdpF subunit
MERLFAMDYIVAGIASILLFVYLVYALLKPERF